jgi:hypothetical protein
MNKSFKNTYRLGLLVFVITTLFASMIFGAFFKSCNSERVVNVNVMDQQKESIHDTVFMNREVVKVIRDTVKVMVKPVLKQMVAPKPDTASR